jgi:hypothetical protein
MSNFLECMARAAKAGEISEEQAVYVRDLFDATHVEMRGGMGDQSADAAAGRAAFDQAKADVAHRNRVKVLSILSYRAREADIKTYPNVDGSARPGRALQALVSPDQRSRTMSLEFYQRSVESDLFAHMDNVLYTFRKTLTGGERAPARMKDVVREIFGQDTGSVSARELAQAWIQTGDLARKRANSAGMRIPKRVNWGMNQSHNAMLVRASSKDEWINFLMEDGGGMLDMSKMRSESTGLPFNDNTLRAALSDVYDSIATEGYNRLMPGAAQRGRALHNRHTDSRFLVFKDPDSWMKYQEKFGSDDIFETMTSHIRSMSRDISMMEMFGPNPEQTVLALKSAARKSVLESGDEKAIEKLGGDLTGFDNLWRTQTRGEATGNQLWANAGSGTRNVLSAAMLGAASVTALADFNTQRLAAAFIGMPTMPLMGRVFREMIQSEDSARFAARMGLVADSYIRAGSASARFFGDHMLPGVTQRIADTTHRLSGLTGITRAGRQAFGLELQGYLADVASKPFNKLDDGLQQIFSRSGVTADDWEMIRATPITTHDGATFLRVLDIADRQDLPAMTRRTLSMKAMSMIQREMDFAVPVPNVRSRTMLKGTSDRGTYVGELARMTGMFKTFPVTITLNNVMRYLNQDTFASKARWMTDFVIGSAVIGGLIMQAKQMMYLRDPRDMTTPEFWGAALLQGGGLGILGDFLFQNVNRFGYGFGSTLAGPGAGLATDAINLTVGNVIQATQGKDMNIGRELTDFVARYTPGTGIWYVRGVYERLILDQLRRMADPDARNRFRRKARNLERNFGQEMWWESGELSPERAPDLSAALGR